MKAFILSLLPIAALNSQFLNAQQGGVLFNDAILHEIRIDNVDTTTFFLQQNKGVYSMTTVTIDGTTIDSAGATTKGNISWTHPNNKRPMKIKLNNFVSGKKYDGIKEFYLHNSYGDPSLMREKLTYDICSQMGLHSLRAAFAKVYINNVYWGVFTLLEAKDELYKRDFANRDAEVYESFDLGSLCVFSQDPMDWAVDNGNPSPGWPRFQMLTNKLANTSSGDYMDTIPEYFNITDFFKYQAVNVYLLNFDSYLAYNGNQLYLFDSINENRFQIIPWDFNASFGLWNTNNYNPNTLPIIPSSLTIKCPFNKINSVPYLRNVYLDAMCSMVNLYCDTLTLNTKITFYYNLIRNAAYSDSRKEPTNSQFDLGANYGYQNYLNDNVPGLKTFVIERWNKITTDLQSLPYACTTGIKTPDNSQQLIIYPNPATSILTIQQGITGYARYSIINMTGQEVQTGELQQSGAVISVGDLPDGVYVVQVTDSEQKIFQQKFMKVSE